MDGVSDPRDPDDEWDAFLDWLDEYDKSLEDTSIDAWLDNLNEEEQ